jgi:hypothetical protein
VIWALLAAFLRKRPPGVQAVMFGSCTGLFVAAGLLGVQRIVEPGSSTLLVLVVAVPAGTAFYGLLLAYRRRGTAPEAAIRVHAAYAVVWLLLLSAAVRELLRANGYRVAVLAIVPIVLMAPPALVGLRLLLGGRTRRLSPLSEDAPGLVGD